MIDVRILGLLTLASGATLVLLLNVCYMGKGYMDWERKHLEAVDRLIKLTEQVEQVEVDRLIKLTEQVEEEDK